VPLTAAISNADVAATTPYMAGEAIAVAATVSSVRREAHALQ
jgi:hypothetical protein